MKEFYKDYFITNDGRVWSNKSKIFMKPQIDKYGYKYITISVRPKCKKFMIHRLVAQYYIENTYDKKCVNHIDGNKLNNLYTNLEWCTVAENNQHAFNIGLKKGTGGVTPTPIKMIDVNGVETVFKSQREAARITKVDQASIYRCLNNKVKTAGGYKWEYIER